LIIIIAAIAFYIVYPKYQFVEEGLVRCNRVTGEIEILVNNNWKSLGKSGRSQVTDVWEEAISDWKSSGKSGKSQDIPGFIPLKP